MSLTESGKVTMSSMHGGTGWDAWDQVAPTLPTSPGSGRSGNGVVWALGALVVVLLVALAGVVGYFLAAGDGQPGAGALVDATSLQPAPAPEQVTVTVAPTQADPPVPVATQGAPTGDRGVLLGDLGLAVPMSRPACDGRGIVVLYSAVTPGAYSQEIASALQQFPGASYLRTDMACPSLRQRDENGNVIYAVYRASGYSKQELCADVRAAGAPAYGRWLDTTSDPSTLVTC